MSAHHSDNPYEVLGVKRNASEAEIKQAYFAQVREHPPERDPEGFKRVRAAYEKLKADKERVEVDLFLIEAGPVALDASAIRHRETPLPEITLETIKRDLLALEAISLLEDLAAYPL